MSQVDDVLAVAINSVLRNEFPTMTRSSLERVKLEILQRCKDRLVHRKVSSEEGVSRTSSVQYAAPPEQDESVLPRPSSPNLAALNSQIPSIINPDKFPSNEYFEEALDTMPDWAFQTASGTHNERSSDRLSYQPFRRLKAKIPSRTPLEMSREVGNSTDSSHTTQLSNSLVLPRSQRTSVTSYSTHPNYGLQPLSEIAESSNSQADLLDNQDEQYETRRIVDNLDPQSEKWMLFDWAQNDNFDFDTSLIPDETENQSHSVTWSDWRT